MEASGRRLALFALCLCLCLSVAILNADAAVAKPGHGIYHCVAKDPKLNDCVERSMQAIFKGMEHEFKEVSVPRMDPLQVPRMIINNDQGPVNLNLDLKNTTQTGLSKAKVLAARAYPEKHYFELDLTVPEYVIKGMYTVKGKVIVLPIEGTGPAEFVFSGIQATWKVTGEAYTKNGKSHMRITKFLVDIKPKKVRTQLDNLFNGNKQLGDTMNRFLNENWEEVYKELKPVIEETFSQILMHMGNIALEKIPYNKIFTDM